MLGRNSLTRTTRRQFTKNRRYRNNPNNYWYYDKKKISSPEPSITDTDWLEFARRINK